MQIVGFSVRLASSLLWIQMYRLGVSSVDNAVSQEPDFDLRNSFLSPPAHVMARQSSESEGTLGGSIYDPAYYSSLFEDAQEYGYQGHKHNIGDVGSTSAAEALQLKSCIGKSFLVVDEESALNNP